jgi:hypothetical protein
MSRRGLCAFLFVVLAYGSVPAVGQPEQGGSPTVGMGVTLNTEAFSLSGPTPAGAPVGFTVPITFGTIRLEPQIGYVRHTQSEASQSETTSALTFGTGAFYRTDFGQTLLLAGARIGVTREVQRFESASTSNERLATVNLFLGPVVGGDYYISDHFSVGAEARFYYINLGQPEGAPPERSASVIRTGGAAFLRFHF